MTRNRFVLAICLFISLSAFSQEKSLVQVMDKMLSNCWSYDGKTLDSGSNASLSAIRWFNSLKTSDKDSLLIVLQERVERASEVDENNPFIRSAEEYLLLAPADDSLRGVILEMLGKVYSDQRDSGNLLATRDRLAYYSALTGEDYNAALSKLDLASSSLKPLSTDFDGTWISDMTDDNGYPSIILSIKGNQVRFDPKSKYYNTNRFIGYGAQKDGSDIPQAFEINDNTDQFLFAFFSQKFTGGNTILANGMYDLSQAAGRANAEYRAQNGVSFSDALSATVTSSIISSIFDIIGKEISAQKSKAYVMTFSGMRIQSGFLRAHLEDVQQKATTGGDYIKNSSFDFNLFRVNPVSDKVVFAEGNVGGVKDYLFREYATQEDEQELKKLARQGTRPARIVGITLGVASLASLTYGGILTLNGSKADDAVMKKKGGIYLGVGGGLLLIDAVVYTILRDTQGPKAFRDFNARQMKKLKDKYGISIAAAPVYDVFTNTAGGAIAMTF